MPFGLSELLARQGLTAPVSPAGVAMPAGAVPVPPSSVGTVPIPDASGMMSPDKMLALMQAFGGLKMPAPVVPDTLKPPAPVAPQGASPTAIANTGNTSAIASLLAAGLRPPPIPALGQLITGR